MAQRKETKKIKVRDLKPSKDAKGGVNTHGPQGPKAHQGPRVRKHLSGRNNGIKLKSRARFDPAVRLCICDATFDQKMTAPHTRRGIRGGCSPQNNRLLNELRAEWQQISFGLIRAVAEESFVEVDAASAAPTVSLFQQACIADGFWGRLCASRSFNRH